MYSEIVEQLHQRAMTLLKQGRMTEAGGVFRQLIEEGSTDPMHMSYHGLTLTMAKRNCRAGLEYCERAMSLGAHAPQLYLNLVRVYEMLGERGNAVKALRGGIRRNPKDKRLIKEIDRLSPRRQPPLKFLHRDQFVNKHLAKMIAKSHADAPGSSDAPVGHKVRKLRHA